MSGLNTKYFPAVAFMKKQQEDWRKQIYQAWRAGVTDEHLWRCIDLGIKPFLEQHGYRLVRDQNHLVKCIRAWAFGHVWIQRNPSKTLYINYVWSAHGQDEEAFEKFLFDIPLDDWEQITSVWHATEFLDDSDIGREQQADLQTCLWHLIDLNISPAYQKFLNSLPYEDSDEEHYIPQQDENAHAFGGDRRTH